MLHNDTFDMFRSNGNLVLELDFAPFTASIPRPTLTKSIGNGVEFLNRHLSAKMFQDKDSMHPLLDFLRLHHHNGRVLITQQNTKIMIENTVF